MSPQSNLETTTTHSNVGVVSGGIRTTLTSGLVSAAVAGSIILGGNIYTDKGQNVTQNFYYGTGATLTYRQDLFSATGASAAGNYYDVASLANPYTGTAALLFAGVDCKKAMILTETDLGVVSAITGSGTQLWDNVIVSTGGTLQWPGSGSTLTQSATSTQKRSATGTVVIPPGYLLKLASKRPFSNDVKCLLWAYMREQYVP